MLYTILISVKFAMTKYSTENILQCISGSHITNKSHRVIHTIKIPSNVISNIPFSVDDSSIIWSAGNEPGSWSAYVESRNELQEESKLQEN